MTCPLGHDPTELTHKFIPTGTSTDTEIDRQEVYVVQCKADGGFFSIFIRGAYTPPIPYDADPT